MAMRGHAFATKFDGEPVVDERCQYAGYMIMKRKSPSRAIITSSAPKNLLENKLRKIDCKAREQNRHELSRFFYDVLRQVQPFVTRASCGLSESPL